MPKKQSLFPVEYDEVSLVDVGASQEANVLIYKRDGRITKAVVPGNAGASGAATSLAGKTGSKAVSSGTRSMSKPCSTKTNSTGAKKGKGKGASQRGKNWKEDRHPRNKKGQMTNSSAKSKGKFGKGGTTKAKLDAKCKKKSVKKVFAFSNWANETLALEKMERKATR